jgi:putative redox protein
VALQAEGLVAHAILRAEVDQMSLGEPKAVIHFTQDDLFIGVTPSNYALTIDTDHERAIAPSPMELLLVALGSCTAVDVISILKKKREQVSAYRIEVRGERRSEHPRSYKRMEVHHVVTGRGVSEKAVSQAIELSETKYCSVAATLRPTAEIVSTFEIIEA